MSKVAIYLNFQGKAEDAFNFYKSVFGTEFSAPIMRIKDLPPNPNGPKFSESDLNCVMHVALPITGGTELMGTDMLESMGHKLVVGNNTTISLQLDSKKKPTNCTMHYRKVEVIKNPCGMSFGDIGVVALINLALDGCLT